MLNRNKFKRKNKEMFANENYIDKFHASEFKRTIINFSHKFKELKDTKK